MKKNKGFKVGFWYTICCAFIITLLGAPLPVLATTHYVDKDASGINNGSSWTNAWRGFSNIDWSSVAPGDTIYISGGNEFQDLF